MVKKLKVNVGMLDAYIRLSVGFSMLGIGTRHKCTPAIILGSMKIAEGITRFCPILFWLEKDTLHWKSGEIED